MIHTTVKGLARSKASGICALFAAGLLSGCTNLSGLSGAMDDFGCPASGGVNCTTVSATYEREHAQDKEQRKIAFADADAHKKSAVPSSVVANEPETDERIRVTVESVDHSSASAEDRYRPIRLETKQAVDHLMNRAPERVVMLWILPWVDAAGDLHSDSRVWMRVKDAAWKIESVRTRAMQTAPERAP